METKSKVDPEAVERVARSWIGTPFADHGRTRGVGVDCDHLVAEIYIELGLVKEFTPPPYTLDGWHAAQNNPVAEYLAQSGIFESIPTTTPRHEWRPGDLITIRIGKVPYHLGILLKNLRFIHALRPRGVIESSMSDATYWVRLNGLYRVK